MSSLLFGAGAGSLVLRTRIGFVASFSVGRCERPPTVVRYSDNALRTPSVRLVVQAGTLGSS